MISLNAIFSRPWTLVGVAFLLGMSGAWIISKYAHRLGLLDKPNERSSHKKVTPKGGGAGILVALLALAPVLKVPVHLWAPLALISIVSFFGDRIHLNQKMRLLLQFACAAVFLSGQFESLKATTGLASAYTFSLCILIAVYITGTANFYNFMDGINGIAGLTGVVGFSGLAVYSHFVAGQPFSPDSQLSLCIACACAGFLPLNFPNARVFMGDVGSILLGFLFASLTIELSSSFLDFLCLNSFLFPFYADELTTMVVRLKARENLLQAHRRHIYQILVNQQKSPHWKISLLYAVLQIAVGAITIAIRPLGMAAIGLWMVVAFASFAVAGTYVRRWEVLPSTAPKPSLSQELEEADRIQREDAL